MTKSILNLPFRTKILKISCSHGNTWRHNASLCSVGQLRILHVKSMFGKYRRHASISSISTNDLRKYTLNLTRNNSLSLYSSIYVVSDNKWPDILRVYTYVWKLEGRSLFLEMNGWRPFPRILLVDLNQPNRNLIATEVQPKHNLSISCGPLKRDKMYC
jgi:hypothetical protein